MFLRPYVSRSVGGLQHGRNKKLFKILIEKLLIRNLLGALGIDHFRVCSHERFSLHTF
jgi:hypothetical protein